MYTLWYLVMQYVHPVFVESNLVVVYFPQLPSVVVRIDLDMHPSSCLCTPLLLSAFLILPSVCLSWTLPAVDTLIE